MLAIVSLFGLTLLRNLPSPLLPPVRVHMVVADRLPSLPSSTIGIVVLPQSTVRAIVRRPWGPRRVHLRPALHARRFVRQPRAADALAVGVSPLRGRTEAHRRARAIPISPTAYPARHRTAWTLLAPSPALCSRRARRTREARPLPLRTNNEQFAHMYMSPSPPSLYQLVFSPSPVSVLHKVI